MSMYMQIRDARYVYINADKGNAAAASSAAAVASAAYADVC